MSQALADPTRNMGRSTGYRGGQTPTDNAYNANAGVPVMPAPRSLNAVPVQAPLPAMSQGSGQANFGQNQNFRNKADSAANTYKMQAFNKWWNQQQASLAPAPAPAPSNPTAVPMPAYTASQSMSGYLAPTPTTPTNAPAPTNAGNPANYKAGNSMGATLAPNNHALNVPTPGGGNPQQSPGQPGAAQGAGMDVNALAKQHGIERGYVGGLGDQLRLMNDQEFMQHIKQTLQGHFYNGKVGNLNDDPQYRQLTGRVDQIDSDRITGANPQGPVPTGDYNRYSQGFAQQEQQNRADIANRALDVPLQREQIRADGTVEAANARAQGQVEAAGKAGESRVQAAREHAQATVDAAKMRVEALQQKGKTEGLSPEDEAEMEYWKTQQNIAARILAAKYADPGDQSKARETLNTPPPKVGKGKGGTPLDQIKAGAQQGPSDVHPDLQGSPIARSPDGRVAVYHNGQWVDGTTKKPIQ